MGLADNPEGQSISPNTQNGPNTPPNQKTPLLQTNSPSPTPPPAEKRSAVLIIYATFLGVFIASADESLVISTYSTIASQFHYLSAGSWLLVAYNFGYCIALPVYGVLSDSYGRKNVLLVSYFLFTLGCFACGASTSLPQLVLARVLAGLSGSGMVSLVSMIIMDLVPAREVAIYRSYENVVNVIGRSMGAPLGGFLSDTIGWRWSFFCQVPVIFFCTIVAVYGLPASLNQRPEEIRQKSRIRDIDFAGIITFSATIITLLFLLQAVGMRDKDQLVGTWTLALAFVFSSCAFIATEMFLARKPLIPMHLLAQKLGVYCLIQILMFSGRAALVSNITPYFTRIFNASDLFASMMYVQVTVGVSIGGIVSGHIIKRYEHEHVKLAVTQPGHKTDYPPNSMRRYKIMSTISFFISILAYFFIFLTWRDGCTTWESFFLFFVGFAPGILFSSLFIGMSCSSPKEYMSICISTYYLCQQLGLIIGPTCGSTLMQWLFQGNLANRLPDIPHKMRIIQNILNDSKFSNTLPEALQHIVRSSYLASFQYLPIFALVTNVVILPVFVLLKEETVE